jgi:uncharacterized membrane protein YgcG
MSAGARGPIANRPARVQVRWPARRLGLAVLLVVAVAAGWLLHGSRTVKRTVTVQVPTAPATVYQDTQAGAVAAAEVTLSQGATACLPSVHCPPAGDYPLGGESGDMWSLGYRIPSYTPRSATVTAWQVEVDSGTSGTGPSGGSSVSWGTTTLTVYWNGTRWEPRVAEQIAPFSGPTPPPNNTTGSASFAFQSAMSAWTRFPGAP